MKNADNSLTIFRRNCTLFFLFVLVFPFIAHTQSIELKNNFFYLDGQKFFVKGIGYEVGAAPGELPWTHTFHPDIMHSDIQRILSGGFNTIRTWAPFTAQELNLLQQYDIKIIMGIWIDPHADFSDAQFVNEAKSIVQNVLSYSKNYDNIIAYLIMNEPLPETIASAGYDATASLWSALIQIIHAQHPNRPVSISNTSNGTYIDPAIFDFSAYNVYIYNPVTVNYLHGYRDFVQYLRQLNVPDRPLIITEYGLSVSPSGPGNWGYGGNSLTEQQEGILHMYASLVDGGAAGSCVFNYSDGWWKGGNEFVHDDSVEEWFGLVEYTNLSDKFGHVRPVWNAVKAFQSAIITQPRSSEIYPTQVPLEIFFDDTVNHVEIYFDTDLVYSHQADAGYLVDTLEFTLPGITDATLVFYCYDVSDNLVKSEEKHILIAPVEVTLPTIEISIADDDFWQTGVVEVNYEIHRVSDFASSSTLEYIFYPHVGFDYGQSFEWTMPNQEQVNYTSEHFISPNIDVFTVGAAIDATYQSFKKRIVTQLTFSRINDLVNRVEADLTEPYPARIFPNPSNEYFTVMFDGQVTTSRFGYAIYNNTGVMLKYDHSAEWNTPVDISELNPGVYFLWTYLAGPASPCVQKIVKF